MRGTASRIRWNALFSFLSSFIRLATNFLLFVGIARLYGAEAFGQFTTAHTFSTIFLLFADFGFDALLATEVARHREQAGELARKYLSMKLLFCSLATLAMLFFPFVHRFSDETRSLMYIFSFYVLFSSLNNFFFALFKGFEQLYHETKISFVINVLLLCALIVSGLMHVPLFIVAVFFVGSRVAGLLLALATASKILPDERMHLSFKGWRDTVPKVANFGLHYLFGNLFFLLDTVLLSFWKGDHEVGIYQSAFKIVALVLILSDVAVNALMPVLSRLHGSDEERWARLGQLLYKTLTLVALPIAAILFVFAEQVVDIIYGAKMFSDAIPVLRIFSVIIFIRFTAETYALALTTSHRQFLRMVIVVIATVVNILLNIWMIPRYGVVGAAISSLITNVFVGITYAVSTRQLFVQWNMDVRWIVSISIAMASAFCLWQFRTTFVWYVAPFVVVLYGVWYYYLGYTKEERALIFASAG